MINCDKCVNYISEQNFCSMYWEHCVKLCDKNIPCQKCIDDKTKEYRENLLSINKYNKKDKENILSSDDKVLLINLICDKQTKIISKNHEKYSSKKYKKLEELKVKIKDM